MLSKVACMLVHQLHTCWLPQGSVLYATIVFYRMLLVCCLFGNEVVSDGMNTAQNDIGQVYTDTDNIKYQVREMCSRIYQSHFLSTEVECAYICSFVFRRA